MSAEGLETRVTALEQEMARLKELIEDKDNVPWWRKWSGAFRDDPYFEKAMKYGQQYRESLRPKPRKSNKGNA